VRELATGTFLDAKRSAIFIRGHRHRKDPSVHRRSLGSYPRPRAGTLLQPGRSRQSARTGKKAAGRSGRLSRKLLRYDLIVIDELGYLPFSQSGGQLLFHLISKLYENTSLLITIISPSPIGATVRRRQNDSHARSPDAPLRHHRDRQRQLALQEPRITSRSPLAARRDRLCSAMREAAPPLSALPLPAQGHYWKQGSQLKAI
jgi:hypothetical protein